MPTEVDELRCSLDRLRSFLESLAVRGLRACAADEVAQLRAFAQDLERSGAAHVAGALSALCAQIEQGGRDAAEGLLMAQISVRMLERLLTLRVARGQYEMAAEAAEAAAAAGDDANDDDAGEDED